MEDLLLKRFTAFAEEAVRTGEDIIVTKELPNGKLDYQIPGIEKIYKSGGDENILVVAVYSEKLWKMPSTVTVGKEVYETKAISSDFPDIWVTIVPLTGTFDEE